MGLVAAIVVVVYFGSWFSWLRVWWKVVDLPPQRLKFLFFCCYSSLGLSKGLTIKDLCWGLGFLSPERSLFLSLHYFTSPEPSKTNEYSVRWTDMGKLVSRLYYFQRDFLPGWRLTQVALHRVLFYRCLLWSLILRSCFTVFEFFPVQKSKCYL